MKSIVALALLLPFPALAEDAASDTAQLYPPLPGVEYFCTDSAGSRVEVGHVICITASCQTWMARCEMTSTNRMAIWRKMQDGCPAVGVMDRLKQASPA